jgi:hypothetical protein
MPLFLVLDCSVAAKWVLPEPGRAPALRVLEQYESGEISLIAPDLLLAELANLLAKRHRRKEISAEQAAQAFHLMRQCAPRLLDCVHDLPAHPICRCSTTYLCGIAFISLSQSNTIVRSSLRTAGFSEALSHDTLPSGYLR